MKLPNADGAQRLRGIRFDKDGTLLDFTPTWLPAYKAGALFVTGYDSGHGSIPFFDAGKSLARAKAARFLSCI